MSKAEQKKGNAGEEASVEALLEAIVSGTDTDAFAVLCQRYANLLDSMVRQFAPSLGIRQNGVSDLLGMDAEELRQEAAMALYKAALCYVPKEDGKGGDVSFGLYAKICIRNAMISQVRRYNRIRKRREKIRQSGNVTEGTDRLPVETELLAGEILRRIQEELSAYENAILPLYLAGKPPRVIAAELGRSEKSVSNGIYRIKVKLRELLQKG